jgi:hypothetical protein
MDNLILFLDKLKNDPNPPTELPQFSINDLNIFKNTNYQDYYHILIYLCLDFVFLDESFDYFDNKQNEILTYITNETKNGNYNYLYTITKIKNYTTHWILKEQIYNFILKLCSNLIPSLYLVINNILKQPNLLDNFINLIIPLIIQTTNSELLLKNLESKIQECNTKIQDLENIIYYYPDIGSEYKIAKNNFEQLQKNL